MSDDKKAERGVHIPYRLAQYMLSYIHMCASETSAPRPGPVRVQMWSGRRCRHFLDLLLRHAGNE